MRPLLNVLPLILVLCSPIAEAKKKKAAPAPPPPPAAKPIPAELQNSVCLVEGDRGRGTGFIATFKGKTVVATNQHVIFGQKNLRITNSQGVEFKPSGGLVASGADAVLLFLADPLPEGVKPFVMSEKVAGTVKEGDEITIVGNSLGGGTLTTTGGRVKAVGPMRLEHDAPTFQGNSGSPVYHHGSGQVISIDSESIKEDLEGNWADKSSAQKSGAAVSGDGVRLFSHRVDTEKEWLTPDWKSFNAATQQLDKIKGALRDAEILYKEGRPALIKDDILRRQFEESQKKFHSGADTEAYNIYIKALDSARTSLEFKIKQLEPQLKAYYHKDQLSKFKGQATGTCRALEIVRDDQALQRAMYAGKYKMPEKVRAVIVVY